MKRAWLLLAFALAGCRNEVDITVEPGPQLSPAMAAATRSLAFAISGADSADVVRPTSAAFATGSERVVYYSRASGPLTIAVTALDGAGSPISRGTTMVRLHGGGVVPALIVLDGKANAAACGADSDCTSGYCTEGICCNQRCDGQCEGCAAPAGSCLPVSGPPRAPRAPCGDGTTCGASCDGVHRDACTLPTAATACGASSCVSGTAVGGQCDGNGSCRVVDTDCGRFTCGSSGCLTSCTSDADCVAGAYCDPSSVCQPWSPALLKTLVIWLDPDHGLTTDAGGSQLVKWSDQSGLGNDALAGGPTPPSLVTTANGHSGAHFAGGYLDLGDAASLRWGTGAFVVEVVTRFTAPAPSNAGSALYIKAVISNAPYAGPILFATDPYFSGLTNPLVAQLEDDSQYQLVYGASLADNAFHIIGMHRGAAGPASAPGNLFDLRSDGNLQVSSTVAAIDASAAGFHATIGGRIPDTLQQLSGDVAEVVAYTGNDSPQDIARLESYLRLKYGL